MMLNIFKVFPVLFLLTFCVHYAKTKTNPDIFSMIDENTLQRKLEFSFNDTLKSSENFPAQNKSKLLHYLSLVSDELNEQNHNEERKYNEDPIPLASTYIELSQDEVKFHEITFDDFVNFKKAPVRLETVIPDGSDPNTVKIIYESKINEIVLSGLAEINGQNSDFVLNLTDLTLREEHERTPSPTGKIVTKSIVETLAFKKFTMLIVSTEGNKHIKSPNKQILRRLADSWLVSVLNAINSRFIQPKIMEQSQQYFKNYKNAFLEAICSSVLEIFSSSTSISNFENANVRSADKDIYDKYIFQDISFNNFSKIFNCSSASLSVEIEKDSCPNENYFSHALNFAFAYSSKRKFGQPSFNWTLRKYSGEKQDPYSGRWNPAKINDEKLSSTVRYWSAKLTMMTDKKENMIGDDIKVVIDFQPDYTGSTSFNYYLNQLLEKLRDQMTASFQDKFQNLLTPPAENSQ